MSLFEKRYTFTSNKRSKKGTMSAIFGLISLLSFILTVAITIGDREGMASRMGGAGFFAALFGLLSIALGIAAVREKDVFPLLPKIGLTLGIVSFLLWGGIIYAGHVGV